jgi:hypothetical protein
MEAKAQPPINLKPLTSLLWPPEPDASIFTDPLKRDDPKPLRHEELLRIGALNSAPQQSAQRLNSVMLTTATSPQLRHLLTATSLPNILLILDAIPSPHARQNSLARILGLDPESLAKPTAGTLLSQRDSPPPLGDLLDTLAGKKEDDDRGWNEQGWWLGHQGSKEGCVWIGEEEKKIMRLFAGAVCQAIDDGEGEELSWGQGGLSWEV